MKPKIPRSDPGMKANLDRIQRRNTTSKTKEAASPEVAAFWLYQGEILGDSVPVDDAEAWGDFANYPRSHDRLWADYQRIGVVPKTLEYDEVPRGRIIYNRTERKICAYADLCILKQAAIVNQIKSMYHLPPNTSFGADEHYVCPACTSSSAQFEGA